jgi:DNA repair photolyase
VLLRLPLTVRPVFLEWLERTQPLRQERVLSRIRATRDGELNDPKFGSRMRGSGAIADQIEQTFRVFAKKNGLDANLPPLRSDLFHPPPGASGQKRLF